MKYPNLVPKILCKTDIHIVIYGEGLTEEGEPIVMYDGNLKCNYQDSGKTVMTAEKKLVEITGTAYFPGDVCPKLDVITDGYAEIKHKYKLLSGPDITPSKSLQPGKQDCITTQRKILRGTKARNPDGTVNYTKLELI